MTSFDEDRIANWLFDARRSGRLPSDASRRNILRHLTERPEGVRLGELIPNGVKALRNASIAAMHREGLVSLSIERVGTNALIRIRLVDRPSPAA
jgi:hypothetical protein